MINISINKVAHYEDCIYKIAERSVKNGISSGLQSREGLMLDAAKEDEHPEGNKGGVMIGGGIRGAATGVLGTAALLGGASLFKTTKHLGGVPSSALKNMSAGAINAFDPFRAGEALKNVKSFNRAGTIGRATKILTNGKQLAQDFGTKAGLGAGIAGAGIGALGAKKDYETAQKIRNNVREEDRRYPRSITPTASIHEHELEKEAFVGGLVTGAKALGTSFMGKSLVQRAAIGSGIGAVGGAVLAKPTIDSNGNAKSNRLSGAMSGALTGGLTGAMISSPKKIAPTKVTTGAAATTASKTKSMSDIAGMKTKNIVPKTTTVSPPKPTMTDIDHMNTKGLGTPKTIQPFNIAKGPKVISPTTSAEISNMNLQDWIPEA